MKKRNILLTVLSVITAICAAMFLTACFSSETRNDGPTTNTSDIVYVSEKDAVITKVNGRDYVKAQDGIAAVGVAYINGYTGPVLVGYDAASVQYTFKYNGTNHVKDYFTVDYNGTTYYYSKNDGFMSGDHRGNCSIYTCAATELYAAALEILAKTEAEKFKLEYNEISTAEQLKAIAGSSERFKLMNTINLGNEDNWTPIENFSGTLFGNGQSINNLTIENSAEENVGLFGTLQGTVTDLIIKNANVTTSGNKEKAGIIAGTNKGIISDVTVNNSCIIEATNYNNVGGIVGYNDCGTILNCKNEGKVTGANNVGGIAGYVCVNANEKIKGCTNDGPINGSDSVGGVIGYLTATGGGSNATYTLSDNKNTINGEVEGKNKVGGVIGEVNGGRWESGWSTYKGYFEISLLTNKAEIKGDTTEKYAGGLIGYAESLNKLTASENYANVTGGNYVGGFVGKADGTDIQAKDGFENEATITGKGYVGGFAGFAGVIEKAINNGTIISKGTILEENGKSINAYVGGIAGRCRGVIECMNNTDIDVSGGQYVGGIAGYVCVYADDHVKKNTNSGKITATGSDCVGGVVGYLTATNGGSSNKVFSVPNNENSGEVTGKNKVGGIFGEVNGGSWESGWSTYKGYFAISLLTNNAEIKGDTTEKYAGGLIGYAVRLKELTSSKNHKAVTGGDYVGGFVGSADEANIQANGFENEATITGKGYVGGFAGFAGVIEKAINSGAIISNGTILESNKSNAYVGGIAGRCRGVIECMNNTDIDVSGGQYVGGIAGYVCVYADDHVKKNTNSGKITAASSDCVGGIVGYLIATNGGSSNKVFSVSYNENSGEVTGMNKVGGIFGEINGGEWDSGSSHRYGQFAITYCNNNSQISGTDYVGGIVGYQLRLKTDVDLLNTNTDVTGKKVGNPS